MATLMVLPLLGQTMEEGTIIKWFKNEGDKVNAGDPLLEVMTDKVNMEVEAPESGILRKILTPADSIVPVKDPICIIGSADESIDDLMTGDSQPTPVEGAATSATEPVEQIQTYEIPAQSSVQVTPSDRVFSSPSARRVAKEQGIDINMLAGRGSGPEGRIVERDVLDYAANRPKTSPLAGKMAADMGIPVSEVMGTGIGRKIMSSDIEAASLPDPMPTAPAEIGSSIPYTGLRKAVAQNVALSAQQSPHVTLVAEVDMTECVNLREQVKGDIEKNYGVKISFTDIIVKAVAKAIMDKPIVNSSLRGDHIVIHDRINIGIATAVENGLMVPVVKNAQSKTLTQVSSEIKAMAARARAGQPAPDDFKDGTFSISNLGVYGIESFNPIITPGQSAILGICRIADKPVARNGEIVIRSMMNICLSFDHKVFDGAPAAEFVARLREILEAPYLIFM